MNDKILIDCDCAPEYSHHCWKCGGTGKRPKNLGELTGPIKPLPLGPVQTEPTMRMDRIGKVYAHLDAEEIKAIAQAVYDKFIEERNKHDEVSLRM